MSFFTKDISRLLYILCIGVTGLMFYVFYFHKLTSVEDLNMEAVDIPLAVSFLEKAKSQKISFYDFAKSDPTLLNLDAENYKMANDYVGIMQFKYMAGQAPLTAFMYLPFIKLFGVTNLAVALYSVTYFAITLALLWLLIHKMYGKWHPFPALWLIMTNLAFLIHIKMVYAVWMPSFLVLTIEAICLYMYMQDGRKIWLILCGFTICLLLLIAWITIAFGVLFCMILIIWNDIKKGITKTFCSLIWIFVPCVVLTAVWIPAYSAYYNLPTSEMAGVLLMGVLNRFFQGGVPIVDLSVSGRLGYAFKCMFVDSTTFDHIDKCIEGVPAVNIIFALLILVGLVYSFKDRKPQDVLILVWALSVFGFLVVAFDFTHRYAIMGVPALAVIASRGCLSLMSEFYKRQLVKTTAITSIFLVGVWLVSAFVTYDNYYRGYEKEKKPDFEVDRVRGHNFIFSWIVKKFDPVDTLVVLGDPIMVSHNSFLFYTAGHSFKFKYYYNTCYNGLGIRTPQAFREWQARMLTEYKNIIFVIPLINFYRTNPIYWHPIVEVNKDIKPALVYSYAGRQPMLAVMHVKRDEP